MQNLKMPTTSIRAVKIVKFFAASLAFSVLFGFLGILSTPAIGADAYHRIIICLKFFIGTFACAVIFFAFMSFAHLMRKVFGLLGGPQMWLLSGSWGDEAENNIKQESLWHIGIRTFFYTLSPFLIVGILVLIVYGFRLIVCFLAPA
jgi:hypothetical protein